MAKRTRLALQAYADDMAAEGGGVLRYEVLFPEQVLGLVELALAGNPRARGLLGMLEGACRDMLGTTPPPLCLLCDYEFAGGREPAAWVVMTAMSERPQRGFINILCPDCAGTRGLGERVAAKIKQNMAPDARILPEAFIHAGSRA
jgi:hypothetical protein